MTTLLALYGGLFLWSFAAATILPLDASFALAGIVIVERRIALPVLIATIGNVLGAATTYWLGRRIPLADPPSRRHGRALIALRRYGAPLLLLAWAPIVGDVIVGLAGAARIRPRDFFFWTTIGKAARYGVVAWAALAAVR